MIPVETMVQTIRARLERGDYATALSETEALLPRVPENRDVLYIMAVSQRYLQQTEAALDSLTRLEAAHPRYSRLYQERGHCLLAARQPGAALEAFLQAVRINPALPASWHALQVLFRSAGRGGESEMAAGHVAKLRALPPEVVAATSLFSDGEVHEAERVVRQFLQVQPDHVEAMRLLARIGLALDVLDDAEFLLESVLAFAPDYHLARHDYVRVLLQRHRHGKALDECRILLCADPENRDYRAAFAAASQALGRYEEAIRIYRELAVEAPNAAELHLSVGHALKTMGNQAEAISAYRMAADTRPSFGDAWWSLANLKTYRFDDADLSRMMAQEASGGISVEDRVHFCFALGKALEDRGECGKSFDYYALGNALQKQKTGHRADTTERNTNLQKAVCDAGFFEARVGWGCARPDPIFIVGLPRAGSTLLEQILASHSQVDGTMELADISRMAVRLQGRAAGESAPAYPAVLRELSPDQIRQFGERYIEDTQIYRTGRPFFIDKNPNNFRHIGLIHLILPNAKIIDARREAMDCCFSNFKQLFASGQEFTYDLGDIGRYYRIYVELMAHWDWVLPGRILRVQHEDVVGDLEGSVRRLLDFCGLAFEEGCLEFYRTERSVRTASSEQVRRPISRDGMGQWRKFEAWLGPLRAALRE